MIGRHRPSETVHAAEESPVAEHIALAEQVALTHRASEALFVRMPLVVGLNQGRWEN